MYTIPIQIISNVAHCMSVLLLFVIFLNLSALKRVARPGKRVAGSVQQPDCLCPRLAGILCECLQQPVGEPDDSDAPLRHAAAESVGRQDGGTSVSLAGDLWSNDYCLASISPRHSRKNDRWRTLDAKTNTLESSPEQSPCKIEACPARRNLAPPIPASSGVSCQR